MTHRSNSVACSSPPTWRRLQPAHGFTLIEVLVVVAIIALLLSILLPSLSRAREQARISMCKANSKQIGTVMAVYQAEHQGQVPVLFNYGAEELRHHATPTKFAGNAMLAVAFRNYEQGLRNLKSMKDANGNLFLPDTVWQSPQRLEFESRIMPAHYACPFGREKGQATPVIESDKIIQGVLYERTRFLGRMHAYSVFQWEGQNVRGLIIPGEQYPTDPGPGVRGIFDGRPKYSVLSWCARRLGVGSYPNHPDTGATMRPVDFIDSTSADGKMTNPDAAVLRRHRKWTARDAQNVFASSLSDVTVIFCMQGQWMHSKRQIFNEGSHNSNQGGGTNAVFADTHVEWVKGTQIGWQ